MRRGPIGLMLLAALTSRAAAQSAGTVGIDGFGRYAFFDNALQLDNKVGGGGAVSVYIVRNLAVEAEASYLQTHDVIGRTQSSIPLRGRLTYNIPLSSARSTSVRLGAGYVRDMYKKDVDFKNDGVTGVAGFRFGISDQVALKVDGTVDYVPSPKQVGVDHYWNFGIQAGLGVLAGNSYDSDKDGVRNRADRCPGTPRGEAVDASGCGASQRDADNDGVMDDRDRCAGTPAGESVNTNGCSAHQLDADGDGVTDADDKCANSPAGEPVDASGCGASQRDADGDGVTDAQDKCADTPAGETVDPSGCSARQLDADADGVADANDKCPGTAPGTPVDASGCPRDSDGDNIPDGVDKCPNTPSGQAVDETGCPVLFKGPERGAVLRGVTFATGKSDLTPDAQLILQDVATSLAANPGVRVEVAGYTDNVGGKAVNQRLSKARAQAVARFLKANGVAPAQITGARGYGPSDPVASNRTAEGRAQNRRVQLNRVE